MLEADAASPVVEDVQLDVGLTPGSGLSCTPHKASMIKLVNRE